MKNIIVCTPKSIPQDQLLKSAENAVKINPLNHAPVERMARFMPQAELTKARISVVITKYWGIGGVYKTVAFMDSPKADLRKRIVQHMNAWSKTANVKFTQTADVSAANVRIAFEGGANGGYWSYLGTEIGEIPKDQQTMNLEAFTKKTPESEFHRVVRHETGHTLGFPHEHMRAALVALIDPAKAIEYFMRTQGWSEEEVREQVLTPLEESSLRGTAPDPKSIMCYQIPGELTKDGNPIIGGLDIDDMDFAFAAQIYPKKLESGATAPVKKVAKKSK